MVLGNVIRRPTSVTHRLCIPKGARLAYSGTMPQIVQFPVAADSASSTVSLPADLRSLDGGQLTGHEMVTIQGPPLDTQKLYLLTDHTAPVPLAPAITPGLLQYLRAPSPYEPYSCISFVQDLLGIRSDLMAAFRREGRYWRDAGADSDVEDGGVILLFTEQTLSHMAVKAAPNLYISKAGPNAPYLVMTSLEAMRFLWQAKTVIAVSRRQAA